MQLIRLERAKCAEIKQAGCALAHARGRTVSDSTEQIQIWGFWSSTSTFISSTLTLRGFQQRLNPSVASTDKTSPLLLRCCGNTTQTFYSSALMSVCVFQILVYILPPPPPTHGCRAVDMSQGRDQGTAGGRAGEWERCGGV